MFETFMKFRAQQYCLCTPLGTVTFELITSRPILESRKSPPSGFAKNGVEARPEMPSPVTYHIEPSETSRKKEKLPFPSRSKGRQICSLLSPMILARLLPTSTHHQSPIPPSTRCMQTFGEPTRFLKNRRIQNGESQTEDSGVNE